MVCADLLKKYLHKGSWRNSGAKKKKELSEKRRELDKAKSRIREIDGIIQKLYEDNVIGKVSDERYATISISLETEQEKLKTKVPKLETELEDVKIATEGLQRFIEKAKAITQLTELTPELVHEFIQKVVVGQTRIQRWETIPKCRNLLQRCWNYPRSHSRRNGRIFPRTP